MKIRDIIEVIQQYEKYKNIMGDYVNRLNNLSVLKPDGTFPSIITEEMKQSLQIMIEHDQKTFNKVKPLLDNVKKEYNEWLETEI